jgi:phasin family protein
MFSIAAHNPGRASKSHHKENCMFPINEQFANAARNIFPAFEQYTDVMKNALPNNEQFANLVRNNVETQLSVLTSLTTSVFESMEKVVDLNLNAGKASLEESGVAIRQLVAAKDPQEFLSLTVAQAQPTAAKAIAYTRHLASIVVAAQAEFSRVTQQQFAASGRKVSSLADGAFKTAPGDPMNAIAIMQTAIRNASAGYEQFNKTTKQAVETMEANMNKAVNQVSQVAEQTGATTTGRARKH